MLKENKTLKALFEVVLNNISNRLICSMALFYGKIGTHEASKLKKPQEKYIFFF